MSKSSSQSFVRPLISFILVIYFGFAFFSSFWDIHSIFTAIAPLLSSNPLIIIVLESFFFFIFSFMAFVLPFFITLVSIALIRRSFLWSFISKQMQKEKKESMIKNFLLSLGLSLGIFIGLEFFLILDPFSPVRYQGLGVAETILLLVMNLILPIFLYVVISEIFTVLFYLGFLLYYNFTKKQIKQMYIPDYY